MSRTDATLECGCTNALSAPSAPQYRPSDSATALAIAARWDSRLLLRIGSDIAGKRADRL
ncbi:Uncharacterised protein [Bordetella pertussis]|nr:Uncharacterised protein [Bordetella pertussis]